MSAPLISADLLKFIKINRDAIATNRGFYYQYLHVVLKWLDHYVNSIEDDIKTEVDEDITEIGDQLVFTQIKCYSSVFSFKSPEIKKSLFNFFSLYLEHSNSSTPVFFHFITNTKISESEQLLQRWFAEQHNIGEETLQQCGNIVSDILFSQINSKIQKSLAKKAISDDEKKTLESNLSLFQKLLDDQNLICDFVTKIKWDFKEVPTEEAVDKIIVDINNYLNHPVFEKRPKKLLFDVLLSEIYRISQLPDPNKRKVNKGILDGLLKSNDDEMVHYIDLRFAQLFHFRVEVLEKDVSIIREKVDGLIDIQKLHGKKLEELSGKKLIPQLITTIPFINSSMIIGRETLIADLQDLLNDNKHVSVNGNGGMGKSSLLKLYISKYVQDYDHIIWINVETGLVSTLNFHEQLAVNLDLPALNPDEFSGRFGLIINKLNQISGNNLLIVDSYDSTEAEMAELQCITNWKMIIGTRLRLENVKTLTIKKLSFEESKAVYLNFDNATDITDEQFISLFKYVEYNTLVIGLVAKTIKYSFDLSLDIMLDHFEQQSLDDDNLNIDIPNDGGQSFNILKILNQTFSLSRIEPAEAYYLTFFAMLPLEDVQFNDLVDWFGEEYKSESRTNLTNAINRLHAKGLIEREGTQITMHKVLRDSIIYQERTKELPFLNQLNNVWCLLKVLKKGADQDLSFALRFLKFGEAMLNVIDEPYRKTIYQPLLQLENEVLNMYNWLGKDNITNKWTSLFERAENHLESTDPLLGLIANNYGIALAADGHLDQAFEHFEQSVSILSLHKEHLPKLFISICNLCNLFIQQRKMDRFKECFENLEHLRQKHNVYDDFSMSIQCQVLALANYEVLNFPEAITLFKLAINLHKELPDENRNDAFLMHYYIKLGESFYFNGELENAYKACMIALTIFKNLNVKVLGYPHPIFNLMYSVAHTKDDHELMEKIKIMKEEYSD
ncbi:ATP-binding protein [Chryseobacterium turcicum]|uniref:ATP-binding protein n=1 Tax=Chryseobacterium turcicum TaxID=2898076 RepID=A0A9Q3YW33_9FLAO|nr:ATP-binding protein [Chryseobacterium turcicum]MCD1117569.1 ATP-binding protein [Chryseobacterium turcicum]